MRTERVRLEKLVFSIMRAVDVIHESSISEMYHGLVGLVCL